MSNSINVYDLPASGNICDQVLREVMTLNNVSFAHVTMQPGAVSLLHQHLAMSEVYVVLEGKGVLYAGNKAVEVTKGIHRLIPPKIPHMLQNVENSSLEHLVFAVPPFDPTDVHLVPDSETQYSFDYCKVLPITAQDGALLYEFLSPQERSKLGIGLAFGILPPRKKATLHYHQKSEEVYYVVAGEGKLSLGSLTHEVQKGNVIHVPINTVHGLENTADKELEVLCLSCPAYRDEDFLLK